jgi:hypothetical protein
MNPPSTFFMQMAGLSFLLFVSDYELEGLLLVCYVKQGGG